MADSEDVVLRANKRFKDIMQNASDSLIDPEVEREVKAYMEFARKKGD